MKILEIISPLTWFLLPVSKVVVSGCHGFHGAVVMCPVLYSEV